jgi:hypothetical protein
VVWLIGRVKPGRGGRIAESLVGHHRDAGLVGDGGFHAGSREDPVVQEPCEGSSRHRLHHQGQNRVSGVAVSEGRAGREQEGIGVLQEREHVAVLELSSLESRTKAW